MSARQPKQFHRNVPQAPQSAVAQGLLRHQRLELTPIGFLRPHPSNARTHSKAQVQEIAASIREFGWTSPIIRDEQNRTLCGHGRLEAAKLLGLREVPTIRVSDLSEAQIRLLMLAENRIGENAGYDDDALALTFKDLADAGLDLSISGFSMPEIDRLLIGSMAEPDEKANSVPVIDPEIPAVAQLGDTWALGRHRLHCGDATDATAYVKLMAGSQAQMVLTDPPYNVVIDGHAGGLGGFHHREFAMASGEMTETQFTAFLSTTMRQLKANSVDGSLHYLFMDWAHLYELLTAARGVFADMKNLCVWNKTNGGMGSLYRSKHELVAIFKSGRASHINNIELGRHGRYRTNVWDYAGVNSFGAARSEELAMHPTVKPVELIADAILDASKRGGIVLDPFAGSGTAIIAAERVGRRAFAMEIDPHYVDVAIKRFQIYTGESARHEGSGRTFDEIARQGRGVAPKGKSTSKRKRRSTRKGAR
jgi:DNA modification methylase